MNILLNANKSHLEEEIKNLQSNYIDVIRQRLGIVIHKHQVQDLLKIIYKGCTHFNCSPEEYLTLILECKNDSPILNHLVSGITIGETYFFRDKQQMELLENELLPQLIKQKRDQNDLSLRIWSAGCASGEEIYTIAMLITEMIKDIEQWTIKLLATDINTESLKKGLAGAYTEWSMRSIPDYYKNQYFEKKETHYNLSKKICDLVTFDYLNLNDNSFPSIFNGTNSQDIILCRNVLIYFNAESSASLMHRFSASLVMGGHLMLGASDPVNMTGTDLRFHKNKGLLFTRAFQEQQNEIVLPVVAVEKTQPKKPLVFKPVVKEIIKTEKIIPTVKRSLSEQAFELANQGRLEEALKLCENGFKSEPTNPLNYFTYALTLLELNKMDEAELAFRKTLFLDNQFVVGHFQLGLLLIRKKQYNAGLKYLKNSIKIAESKDPSELVIGTPGLTYHTLAEILRNEINLYLTTGAEHED